MKHKYTNALILMVFGSILIYATFALPNRGDLTATLNRDTSPTGTPNAGVHYIKHSFEDDHTENMVTVTLADYRGYDTLGETTVIFTAGLICFLLLRRTREEQETGTVSETGTVQDKTSDTGTGKPTRTRSRTRTRTTGKKDSGEVKASEE